MNKRIVLIFMDWYLPGYKAGGPVSTCANLVKRLGDEFDFRVVTRNTDLNENVPYNSIKSDNWVVGPEGTKTYYFSKENLTIRNIKKLLIEVRPDVIHLNSLFSLYFTVFPVWIAQHNLPDCRIVLGPRGMLSKGALAIKPFRKNIFLLLIKATGLFRHVTWHASTPIEAAEIEHTFGKNTKVKLGIDLAPVHNNSIEKKGKKPGEALLFYLGRISPVKNLLQCIISLQRLEISCNITYDIYGPVEDIPYWEQCQAEIRKLPASIQVNYKGHIMHEQLNGTLIHYHFLLLLTENENYGHAIVESMVCGCPVIISDRTPWRNLHKITAGWDLSLENAAAINTALVTAINMDQSTYNSWSASAYKKGFQIAENAASVEENKNLFR